MTGDRIGLKFGGLEADVFDMKTTADLYLDSLDDRAATTRLEYRRELERLIESVPKAPGDVTTMDVELHLHERCAGLSAATRKKALVVLGGYFDYLHQRGVIPTNPVRPIRVPHVRIPEPTWWTPDEIRRILAAPMNPRDHLLLETLARTGARAGVVRRLRWASVRTDLKDPAIHFDPGKGGKRAAIPMDKELIHDFVTYRRLTQPSPDDWVFRSQMGGHLSNQQVNRIIEVACRKAAVRVSSAHEFRRSVATNLLQAGVPLDVVSRDILQHASPVTTMQHYRGAEQERVRQALRGLPY